MEGKVPVEILAVLPAEFACRHKIVPLQLKNGVLEVGLCQSDNESLLSDLEFLTGNPVAPVRLSAMEMAEALKKVYGPQLPQTSAPNEYGEFHLVEKERDANNNDQPNGRKLQKESDEISVVNLVNQIITEAIERGASDIHIEPYEQQFRARFRIDGSLQEAFQLPLEKKPAIISRLKIMAELDIAEKRRPQDGRIRVKRGSAGSTSSPQASSPHAGSAGSRRVDSAIAGGELAAGGEPVEPQVIDIRVSTLPTDFGEKVVLRILDKSQLNLDLENLGFEAPALKLFKNAINAPFGMILVTGPTGSGKTTTLYAALNALNSPDQNILTIEDPIEYNLPGINQSHVRSDIGFTFAKALRAFLRQDPDIIMVGEIRDQETAEIAVRAALTGHLVLSTLHTNDAPSALTRLLDMGLESFLISSSVKMVIAQRLVRKICPHCQNNNPTISAPSTSERQAHAMPSAPCKTVTRFTLHDEKSQATRQQATSNQQPACDSHGEALSVGRFPIRWKEI